MVILNNPYSPEQTLRLVGGGCGGGRRTERISFDFDKGKYTPYVIYFDNLGKLKLFFCLNFRRVGFCIRNKKTYI